MARMEKMMTRGAWIWRGPTLGAVTTLPAIRRSYAEATSSAGE